MTNDEVKKIDEWEIQGKNAELWVVKGNLQVRYLGTIHNIPLSSVIAKKMPRHYGYGPCISSKQCPYRKEVK